MSGVGWAGRAADYVALSRAIWACSEVLAACEERLISFTSASLLCAGESAAPGWLRVLPFQPGRHRAPSSSAAWYVFGVRTGPWKVRRDLRLGGAP